ncbi:unnamed protein product, partial [Discosporangium mesarthrocarpum]
RYGEQPGGRDIYPNKDGVFDVCQSERFTVKAAPMKHTIPCVGYVVEESSRPGRLKHEDLEPLLLEHKEAIMASGIKNPMRIFRDIKEMKPGETFVIPGTDKKIPYDQAMTAPLNGRKV